MTDQNPRTAIALGDHRNDFRDNSLIELVSKHLVRGSILDIGCGTGYYIHRFQGMGFRCCGIEPNEDMVAESRRIFGKLNIRNCRIEELNTSDRFDNIVMFDVLEHIKDDKAVLCNCFDMLNDNGRLLLNVPAYPWLWGRRDIIFKHYRRYRKKELEAMLESTGFKVMVSRYWNFGLLLPYAFLRNWKKEESYADMRRKGSRLCRILSWWFLNVENKVKFPFGINIIVAAEKIGL